MKTLNDLIDALEANERVVNYRKLAQRILSDTDRNQRYQELLKAQQLLVQAKHARGNDYHTNHQEYLKKLNLLTEDPLIAQYLHTQSEVNALIQSITHLIEGALSKPLKSI